MKITLDSNLWIDLIQLRKGHEHVSILTEWHKSGKVEILVSDRFFSADTVEMTDLCKKKNFRRLFNDLGIHLVPSIFRFSTSTLSGGDRLGGGNTGRSTEELSTFRRIAEIDPTERTSKRRHHIGDYDALFDHFCSDGDVFITRDNKNIFSDDKRRRYLSEIGLQIMGPAEFIAANS